MSRFRWLTSIVVVGLIIASCKSTVDPTDPNATSTVTTTITGLVLDEFGDPVQGARVSGHGATASTNAFGVFVLRNVTAPSDRCVVLVRRSGYFTGARAAQPIANKITNMMLTLQESNMTRSINAASGGTVAADGATVQLPANGFVDASGASYSGTVSVAMRYQDPSDRDFYGSFSGDMAAIRADGSQAELTSYGVIRIELTGSSGQSLQLKGGTTATLTYPAAGSTAPSIPLWHFDETKGIWVEQGSATLNGGVYTGTVTHFTDWNLDVPSARRAFLEGRVTCGDNMPLAGVIVDIGQVSVMTDEAGFYKRRVPADATFDVEVKADRNNGMSSAPVSVGPLALDETKNLDIVVSPCPTILEATMVDCNDRPIGGFIQITTPTGVRTASSSTGTFRVIVPGGVALSIDGFSYDARTITTTPVAAIAVGTAYNAGTLKACSGVETSYLDIQLPDSVTVGRVALNATGSKLALTSMFKVYVYDVASGQQEWMSPISGGSQSSYAAGLAFVANDARVAVLGYSGTQVFDAATGAAVCSVVAMGMQGITPDGTSIYVLQDSAGAKLHAYSGLTGVLQRTITLQGAQPQMRLVGLQGNGHAVMQGFSPNSVVTYDLADGSIARTLDLGLQRGEVFGLSPSGKVIAASLSPGGAVGSLVFFDLITGQQISQGSDSVRVLAISPDDAEYVALAGDAQMPTTHDVLTQSLRRVLPVLGGSNTSSQAFGYSGDAVKLASAYNGKDPNNNVRTVRIYTLR